MKITKLIFNVFLLLNGIFAQQSLDYFIERAKQNAPQLAEYRYLQQTNQLQQKLNRAENSAFKFSISGDYLFAPYFNNHGDIVSTNPSADAYGYDVGITNGGLYSAQFNLEKNVFNGNLLGALDKQASILDKTYDYKYELERHNLEKQVTDQYLNTARSLQLARLAAKNVANLKEQLILTEEMLDKGYAKSQDYLLLKIELENQKANSNNAHNDYHNARLQLNSICGIKDTSAAEIAPITLGNKQSPASSNFIQKYRIDSLGIANQQEIFETKYDPQITLFANAGLNALELNRIEHRLGMSAGISLSLAILDGNQKSLTRQQNFINQKNITEYRDFAKNNLHLQHISSEKRMKSLKRNLKSIDKQITDYRQVLDISSDQLRLGNMSMIDYLTLLRGFNELEKQKIEKETDYQLEINNYNYWNW
ncbi:MAG: TolC family protein [Calditrichaeota bacterium]|nr:TolC family protein [Calditrichota bacterium]